MSVSAPAHARNLQTNINQSRYFFATQEAGEQELFLSTIGGGGPNGNISSLAVGISGPAGNAVVVSEGPSYMASEFISADQGAIFGSGSTYWTGSTIASTITGVSLSSDRLPGTGIASIESYAANGSTGGFEFLSRGVNGVVVSSVNTAFNQYVSTLGRPGATAVLGASGTMLAGNEFEAPFFTSLGPQAGGGGRPCFGIQDLSGAGGLTPQARWSIGTTGIATGGNTGSDMTFFSYSDAGNFITSAMTMKRADGAMAIVNISSMYTQTATATGQIFPCSKTNVEFGIPAAGNTAPVTPTLQVLFSTPVANLNPNTQTLLNINWANAVSTSAKAINYKVGFSTATAYTNVLQTSYVPGGGWSPGGAPAATRIGNTNLCCILDSDGIAANGTGFLYVAAQTTDGTSDILYVDKGTVTEPTRNALCYRPV